MVSSTHGLPDSDPAWVVPPGSAIRLDPGKRRRTSRLPRNGVAASSVSSISRTGVRAAVHLHRGARSGGPEQARRVVPGV